MSARIPQVGDTIRHADDRSFGYYGEGTVQRLSGVGDTHMSVWFPKRGANYTFARDDADLQASEAAPAAPDATPAPRPRREAATPAPRATARTKPTDKQVRYAMSLLAKTQRDDDLTFGAGDDDATRKSLERMTSAQVSSLINHLKNGR
jgi:hypothetical protein